MPPHLPREVLVHEPEIACSCGSCNPARLVKLGEAHGIISRGLPSDTIAFSPPLIITEAEITEMLDRMEAALNELTVQVRRERMAAV